VILYFIVNLACSVKVIENKNLENNNNFAAQKRLRSVWGGAIYVEGTGAT
jgi:hypothetical protein